MRHHWCKPGLLGGVFIVRKGFFGEKQPTWAYWLLQRKILWHFPTCITTAIATTTTEQQQRQEQQQQQPRPRRRRRPPPLCIVPLCTTTTTTTPTTAAAATTNNNSEDNPNARITISSILSCQESIISWISEKTWVTNRTGVWA